MLTREIVVILGRIFLYYKDKSLDIIKALPVTYLGKITTTVQILTVVLIVFNFYKDFFIAITIILSISTGIQYFFKGYEFIHKK